MKKIRLIGLIILFCASTTVCGAQDTPKVAAHGAILVDALTGRVLWEKDAAKQLAMASTTKIMTAILALEMGDFDNDIVTVSRRAAVAPRVKMYLQEGEEIALSGLIYALMLQSSNDAAVAIAEFIGGSVEEFCAAMTAKARQLGAQNTIFETPNGLDAENHQSTAYDMALIARYAMSNTMFLEIINTVSKEVTSSRRTYNITNKNRLLHEFEGANGIKTGYTGKAGHCFVGAARRDDMQLISVVFASGWGPRGKEQKWVDTKEILSYGFDNFAYELILSEGDVAGVLAVERSRTPQIELYYGESILLPLTAEERAAIAVEPRFPAGLTAPVGENQAVGEGRIYLDGEYYASVPILTSQGATRHDFRTSVSKVWKEFTK